LALQEHLTECACSDLGGENSSKFELA